MQMAIPVGIDAISLYSPHYFMDMRRLAAMRKLPPQAFVTGIGQEKMAVPPPGEDIVTMAANAAEQALANVDKNSISTLLLATESGIDQSKSAGVYVHSLLGLPHRCRVVELKQACYGATAGLQLAIPQLRQNPRQKIVLVAADVARYGLGTPGEPTQGGGAVAMVLSAEPRIMEFGDISGFYTEDVMDFWRPNYRDEAFVDGKASIRMYIKCLLETWRQYQQQTGCRITEFERFCYHLPFTRMGEKAHLHLMKSEGIQCTDPMLEQQLSDSLVYNRQIGNSYAASLYIAICSLLDHSTTDLHGLKIACFSYGSGCVAEFFSGMVRPGYRQYTFSTQHRQALDRREEISESTYETFYNFSLPVNDDSFKMGEYQTGRYRLTAIKDHKRIYVSLANNASPA